jgi:group I intron endonuclease
MNKDETGGEGGCSRLGGKYPLVAGIYRIALEDGRCYVGQSVDVEWRWYIHRWDLNNGAHHSPYLQRCWSKYGEGAFIHEMLEVCDTDGLDVKTVRDLLAEREQYWMDKLQPVFNSDPAAGSPLGRKHTAESRAKMSAAQKGKPKPLGHGAKVSAALKGRPKSPEHRANLWATRKDKPLTQKEQDHLRSMSEGNIGRKASLETRKKMSTSMKVAAAERRERLAKEAAEAAKENNG